MSLYKNIIPFVCLLVSSCLAYKKNYTDYHIYSINVTDQSVVPLLREMEWEHWHENDSDMVIIKEGVRDSPFTTLVVSPKIREHFRQNITSKQIDHRVMHENLQSFFDRETETIENNRRLKARTISDEFPVRDFPFTHKKMQQWMMEAHEKYPTAVKLISLGRSSEGKELSGIKGIIGYTNHSEKGTVFFEAGTHAREWLASHAALYAANKILTSALNDDSTTQSLWTQYLSDFDIIIVPSVNPDGYEYSLNNDRLWRKSRSHHSMRRSWACTGDCVRAKDCYKRERCVGVDINRNFDFHWGEGVYEDPCNPCSDMYPGPNAFTEPEAVAIRDYIKELGASNVCAYVSLHAFGQYIFAPWGYTRAMPPAEKWEKMERFGNRAKNEIKEKGGRTYKFGTSANVLYVNSGDSTDYMVNAGITHSYAIELPPHYKHQDWTGLTKAEYERKSDVFLRKGLTLSADLLTEGGEDVFQFILTLLDNLSTEDRTPPSEPSNVL